MQNGHERTLLAAQGYLELGMFTEVWKELHTLPAEMLGLPEVLEIFVRSLMGERRWEDALTVARRLRTEHPAEPGGYIHEAYCLHELGQTEVALQVLMQGPASLRRRAVFFYNAGCYLACLGDAGRALELLEKSFEMDAGLKRCARHDPDLAELRDLLQGKT